jgi:hypothetical protein
MVVPHIDKTAEKNNLIGYEEKDNSKNNRNTLKYEGGVQIPPNTDSFYCKTGKF